MSENHKRTHRRIGALAGFYMVSLFLKGKPIDKIAELHSCSYTSVAQILAAYMELQKIVSKNEILLARLGGIAASSTENELLDMPNSKFYEHTKLDPNNRWWVGKGKMI